jgi:Ser/Thr protein kinase RdoA (MazF antagonist)
MRDLPDNASLDHLRRQAKDQLAVLRRTKPDATLTDAQASVAQQYGFGNWTELKNEVERRSAAPPLAADERLSERLAIAFGLGTVSGPMTHAERQWTGQIWDLTTTDGRWVVTALADFVAPGHIETEAELVERAIAAGVLAPEPVRTTAGPFVLALDGTNWRAHRWIQLGPPSPQPPLPQIAAEGGRILARIHRLDLEPPEPVVPWLTQRWTEPHWQRLVDKARAADRVWAADFARAIPGFLDLDIVCDRRDPNPRAVLSKAWHAPTAVRLAGADRLIAVGWEHASAVPKDWDLGAALMSWSETVENDYDPAAARAFLDGYRELADDIDVTLPMFTSGVTAALNWTISRANIALHDDNPAERELAERNIRILARNPVNLDNIRRLADTLT